MAEETSGRIEIKASAAEVAAVIADLGAYPSWTDGMTNPLIGELDASGRPATASFDIAAGPVQDRVSLDYQWAADSVSWRLNQAKSLRALDGRYQWHERNSITEVTYTLSLELATPLPSLVRKLAASAIIDSALKGLKKRVEAGR